MILKVHTYKCIFVSQVRQRKLHFVKDGVVPSIFPWSSPSTQDRPVDHPVERETPAKEHDIPSYDKLISEVNVSSMKEEEDQCVETVAEEEEVTEVDSGEPTLHCGECDFKARSVDAVKSHRMKEHLGCWVRNLKSRPEMRLGRGIPMRTHRGCPPGMPSWSNGLRRHYPCPLCDVRLESFANLPRHLLRFHSYSKKTFLCRFCHISSMTREEWSSHYSNCHRYTEYIQSVVFA